MELDVAVRSPYLDEICASDPELRSEIESLLLAHDRAGDKFLQHPAIDLLNGVPGDIPRPSRVGSRLGVYEIVETIAHGGMGEVYRARRADGQYEKSVAIKLVRVGLDTSFVLERFRHERQILASLDHPCIAHLLDGGTTEEGVPYLVMELIAGVPIDQYCDEHHLSIPQRLQLFRQVCSAVQYAHQRLVIHRDLKPSNILVTSDGVPKLLDFGIAKIVDTSSSPAETTLLRAMTPEYASPEQIQGGPITTATDVYSLGVVLYLLLTGRCPYRVKSRTQHELARAIVECDAAAPSAIIFQNEDASLGEAAAQFGSKGEGTLVKLRRRLEGDLDNIVLKALRKQPERRYVSVEQFDEDLRRQLAGLPVLARKDSWHYRAGKFARRNKLGIAATAAAIMMLLGGVAGILREAQVARAERAQAEHRFNDVRKLANSLIFEVDDSIRDLPGSTQPRRLIVTRALEYLDSLSRESKGDASLQLELASAYDRVGDVLGFPYGANLGDQAGALESYRKALEIRESLLAGRAGDLQLHETVARNYFTIARVLEATGDFHGALEATQRGLSIAQSVPRNDMNSDQTDRFAGGYYIIAGLLIQTGDPAAALQNYRRAAAIRESGLSKDSTNMSLRSHLAADYAGQAKALAKQGDLSNAAQTQINAIDILQKVSQEYPQNATLREYVGEAVSGLADFQIAQGNASAALVTRRASHAIFANLLTADPKNSLAKSNFAFSDNGIGNSLARLGKPDAAIKAFREAIQAFEEMSPNTTRDRYPRSGLADAYSGLGVAYALLARSEPTLAERATLWQQARASCAKSLTIWKDKQVRGELESDELGEAEKVQQCISDCDAHLKIQVAKGMTP